VVEGNPVERLRAVRETQALQRAVERLHGADHRLDVRQPEPVLVEDCEAPAHQLVVVGLARVVRHSVAMPVRSATLIQISGTRTPSRSRHAIMWRDQSEGRQR
jgi:hypothetical protein